MMGGITALKKADVLVFLAVETMSFDGRLVSFARRLSLFFIYILFSPSRKSGDDSSTKSRRKLGFS